MQHNYWIYLLIMFAVTYLVRVLPLVVFRKKITNRFVRSFLAYIPYAVLAAMTFPAVLVYFLDYGIGRLSKADTWLRTYNFAYFIDPNQGGENCLRLVPFLVITVGLLIGEYLLYAALNVRREAIER